MQVTSQREAEGQGKKRKRRIVGKDALSEGIADGKEAFLKSQISVLGLDSRAEKGLLKAGIETVGDLVRKTEDELKAVDGFGQKALFTVKWILATERISLFTGHIDDYPGPQEGEVDERLAMSVDSLELSVRTWHVLRDANIRTIGELVATSASEILKMKHAGRRVLKDIRGALAGMGLKLKDSPEEQKSPEQEDIFTLEIDEVTKRTLNSAGIRNIEDLTELGEYGLLQIRRIGRHRAKEIKEALRKKGLDLKPIKPGGTDSCMAIPINALKLSKITTRILVSNDIYTVGDLVANNSSKILNMEGVGVGKLKEIAKILDNLGLRLWEGSEDQDVQAKMLAMSVDVLELSARTVSVLRSAYIRTIGELTATTAGEILEMKHAGRNVLKEITEALGCMNLGFSEPHNDHGTRERYNAMSVEDLGLSVRTTNVLRNGNINTVGDLTRTSSGEIMKIKNAGRRTVGEIKEMLGFLGLELSDRRMLKEVKEVLGSVGLEFSGRQKQLKERGLESIGIYGVVQMRLNFTGVMTVGALTEMSEYDLLRIKGIGSHRVKMIKSALRKKGLALKPTNPQETTTKAPSSVVQEEDIDSAEDGQEHFIAMGMLDTETPAHTGRSTVANEDTWNGDIYQRMSEGELLDTARILMETEEMVGRESFRASAPGLYEALERRRLCGYLFVTPEVGDAKNSAGDGIQAETKTTSALGQLSALAEEARAEVEKLLETVKPENLRATLKLLDNL